MEEKPVIYGGLTAYRTRGDYLRRLEQYPESIAAHDTAYGINADDVRNLMGRSLSCSMAMRSQQAYDNAELALSREPRNLLAHKVQAQAMYTMTEFERSIVTNSRGNRYRPSYFQEGLNQGLETIQDCIGKGAGQVLYDFLPLIKENEAKYTDDPLPPIRVSRMPQPEAKSRISQKEAYQFNKLSRVLAMKYLGPMANDKFFLDDLLKDKRMISANEEGNRELQKIVSEAHNALSDRQELLRASRPYYTIRQAEKTTSQRQTAFLQRVLKQERIDSHRMAKRLLKAARHEKRVGNIKDMVRIAERMQIYLDTKTPRTLPPKDKYIHRLYRIVGDGYLSLYHLSTRHSEPGHRNRIAFLMGLSLRRPQSFDSVRAKYPQKHGDLNKPIEKLTAYLDICENSTQRCWLHYELSRLYVSLKNYSPAKYHAKQCQHVAEEMNDLTWWLNGCFVILSVELQQGNVSEVKVVVREAKEWIAKLESRGDAIGRFLDKCAEIAVDCVVTDEGTVIKMREKQILKGMTDPERVEEQVLLKRIRTVPPGRRFCVLPKKAVPSSMESERRQYNQPGLTVVPGQPITLPAIPKAKIKGLFAIKL